MKLLSCAGSWASVTILHHAFQIYIATPGFSEFQTHSTAFTFLLECVKNTSNPEQPSTVIHLHNCLPLREWLHLIGRGQTLSDHPWRFSLSVPCLIQWLHQVLLVLTLKYFSGPFTFFHLWSPSVQSTITISFLGRTPGLQHVCPALHLTLHQSQIWSCHFLSLLCS